MDQWGTMMLAVVALVIGCQEQGHDEGRRLSGTVGSIAPSPDGTVQLLVENIESRITAVPFAVILVSPETSVLRARQGELVPASVGEIGQGDSIEVWIGPEELRSDPPQYHANRIIIKQTP